MAVRGAVLALAALVLLLVGRVMLNVVLITEHQLPWQCPRILSVLSTLVWNNIRWTRIFELISDLVEVRQQRVVPGMPGRRRCHSLEWEAQRRLVDASEVAVLGLVEITGRLCQVQLVQLVSNVRMVVFDAVAACG